MTVLPVSTEDFFHSDSQQPFFDGSQRFGDISVEQMALDLDPSSMPDSYSHASGMKTYRHPMSRSRTHPPLSFHQTPELQRNQTISMGALYQPYRVPQTSQFQCGSVRPSACEDLSLLPAVKRRRTNTGHRQFMPAVLEQPVMEEFSPGEYSDYIRHTNLGFMNTDQYTSAIPAFTQPNYSNHNYSTPALVDYDFNSFTPSESQLPSPVFSTDMSRQSSGLACSVTDGFDMLRIQSEQNMMKAAQDMGYYSTAFTDNMSSESTVYKTDQYSYSPPREHAQNPPTRTSRHGSSSEQAPKMIKEEKIEAPKRINRHRHPAIQIAPKVEQGHTQSSIFHPRTISIDGKEKCQIARSTKVSLQALKVYCTECDKHPEGFRGEHELRRHAERAHPKTTRKVWVCIDPLGNDPAFAKCKACIADKPYNAYYNAAAHLRRVHFYPKQPGKGHKPRGGSGGGDQPPMEELKSMRMKEIEIPVNDTSTFHLGGDSKDPISTHSHNDKASYLSADEDTDESNYNTMQNSYESSVMEQMVMSNDYPLFAEDFTSPLYQHIQANDSFSLSPSSFHFTDNTPGSCNVSSQDSMLFV